MSRFEDRDGKSEGGRAGAKPGGRTPGEGSRGERAPRRYVEAGDRPGPRGRSAAGERAADGGRTGARGRFGAGGRAPAGGRAAPDRRDAGPRRDDGRRGGYGGGARDAGRSAGRGKAARSAAEQAFTAGTTMRLRVGRELSPYGFFLTDGEHEVLLHYSEKEGEVRPDDVLDVFIYYDSEDRIAATMKKPLIRLGEVALLEVADLHPRFGSFLDMGLSRHLLLPYQEQPELEEYRPQVGDKVYVRLDRDKQGRLLARLAREQDLLPLAFTAPTAWKNQWLDARVYNSLQQQAFVICGYGVLGFGAIGMLHATERTKPLRIGEEIKVRAVHIREDGRINVSMRAAKQIARGEDADNILNFLKARPNGAMPYSDDTPSDIISSRFGISKSAFKRAVGKLMKEGLVYQKENWTYLSADAANGNDAEARPEG